MDASSALSDLVGLSTQVVEAVITGPEGRVEAARTSGDERTATLAASGAELIAAAADIRAGGPAVERVHVDLEGGSLVVVGDGVRTIVATTVAEPTVGLVAYDLRAALAKLREEGA
jgi:predicted regulator of Ras-like GTPase activity (Roadblock/LC7/MglB family)